MTICQNLEIMTPFYKFHGTGNDFIMLDSRQLKTFPSAGSIAFLCHRHFGIGADGLIIVAPKDGYDFEMIYYNADGSHADMCGNGARCAVAFASMIGITGNQAVFLTGDGPHSAEIKAISENNWIVAISMRDVEIPAEYGDQTRINTGTPHFVNIVGDVNKINVPEEGRSIRYSDEFKQNGINVDWLCIDNDLLKVRTYERGVEDETLSCGTGVTACAIVAALTTGKTSWNIETPGGRLFVKMEPESDFFRSIILEGPVKLVFKGDIKLEI
ncbi:MAG: diaminopimelate epimerase [Lentimicrobium sp.]|nr:diaminopimelate epimerase [Lentimicrobium sp.]